MVSAANAPWLQTPDWSSVMSRGAAAGAEIAGNRLKAEQIANQARQAAAELNYRYAALASQNARANADAQAQKEAMTAAAELKANNEAQGMARWQAEQDLKERQFGFDQTKKGGGADIYHSGANPLLRVNRETGQIETVYEPPADKLFNAERTRAAFDRLNIARKNAGEARGSRAKSAADELIAAQAEVDSLLPKTPAPPQAASPSEISMQIGGRKMDKRRVGFFDAEQIPEGALLMRGTNAPASLRGTNAPAAVLPQDEGEIVVISPDGVEGTIPASQLADALKEGYKRK